MVEDGRSLLGEAMKWLRESHRPRLTQEQLAELTGVPKGSISSVEAGVSRNPRPHVIDPLLDFFNMTSQADAISAYRRHVLGDAGDVLEQAQKVAQEAGAKAARDEIARAGVIPITQVTGDGAATINHLAVVSCGPGAGSRDDGTVEIPRSWVKGRDLFAVTASGTCMTDIPDGATVIVERLANPQRAPNSSATRPPTRYVVWVEGEVDDVGGNIKYVERFSQKARLTADDGSKVVVDLAQLHIVGRVVGWFVEP